MYYYLMGLDAAYPIDLLFDHRLPNSQVNECVGLAESETNQRFLSLGTRHSALRTPHCALSTMCVIQHVSKVSQ